jgi:membrane-associated phospholipid phosphatase
MVPHRNLLIGSAVAALAVFTVLWIGYVSQWNWLTALDTDALDSLYRFGVTHRGWVTFWDMYCTVLSPATLRIIGVGVIVVALVRRNIRTAVFLFITVELSAVLTGTTKFVADRPRPLTALVHAASTSFPSGHAVGVIVCVLAYLVVGWPLLRPPWRGWALLLGAVVVVTIGVGRVVLNVHHPSDVLAGWALGYAYFAACLLVAAPARPVTEPDQTPAAPGTAP